MTITDQLYQHMLTKEVVTLEEVTQVLANLLNKKVTSRYVIRGYLTSLRQRGVIEQVKRGLYIAGVPSSKGLQFPTAQGIRTQAPDKFLIASKIRKTGILSHHTALEIHRASQTLGWKVVYVTTPHKKRFRGFSFRGINYRCVTVHYSRIGITETTHRGQLIRTTTPERCFVDCLDRPDLCGGWEEVLKSIGQLRLYNSDQLLEVVLERNNQSLIRRVGLILERLNNNPKTIYLRGAEKVLRKLRSYLTDYSLYLVRGEGIAELGPMVRSDPWKLYYPRDFWEFYERGV